MDDVVRPYEQGHLLVAAVRLLTHRHRRPPSVEELSEMLDLSAEMVHFLCNRLAQQGVLDVVEAAFSERITIRDHLKLEELPREEKASSFAGELEQFQAERMRHQQEIQKAREMHETTKKDLFSELDRQLKEGVVRKKRNPLDDL